MDIPYERVLMKRANLDDLPRFDWPAGYALRWYEQGDRQMWLDVHHLAETHINVVGETFDKNFGDDHDVLAQRMAFVVDDDGEAVGTASAWYGDEQHGVDAGRVHWVAIVPEHQGRGLAKPLLAAVCARMAELGHGWAYLSTASPRITAINLYLKFGFTPMVEDEQQRAAWQAIAGRLRYPIEV